MEEIKISCVHVELLAEQLIKITEKFNKNLVCPDMDAMNFVFQNNYKEIDYKYCVCAHLNIKKINKQNLFEAFDNPFIIHYSGHKKPWIRGDTKFFKEYMRILLKTEFKYLINNL